MKTYILLIAVVIMTSTTFAQNLMPIELPKPITSGGKPLMDCLKERHSTREYSPQPLPLQTLSNLLWAAWGINRADIDKRTAPSAMNRQEVEVYVALPDGVFMYDAKANKLNPILAGDHRAKTGKQDFVSMAALDLVYVADFSKMTDVSGDDRILYSAADVGFIAQNVYLFCTSENLGCVVRGWVDRAELAKTLKLRADQKIILAQTVGFPKE
ncbi:MAG: SagB/ThcOx family dehydrogenase [bacterium]|nr:SagB/ThcOx family dehydrogenase [bacterium]